MFCFNFNANIFQWTVNGELRIGLFTKKAVQANEELTFDYQFQTFGKKRHKCYCGSEKCRGYLGSSSNNSGSGTGGTGGVNPTLDYIWEEESSEESSDEEDHEDDSEVEIEDDDKSEKSESKLDIDASNKRHKDSKDFDVGLSFNLKGK